MVEGNQETHHGTRVVRKPPGEIGPQGTVEPGPTPQGEHAPAGGDHAEKTARAIPVTMLDLDDQAAPITSRQ